MVRHAPRPPAGCSRKSGGAWLHATAQRCHKLQPCPTMPCEGGPHARTPLAPHATAALKVSHRVSHRTTVHAPPLTHPQDVAVVLDGIQCHARGGLRLGPRAGHSRAGPAGSGGAARVARQQARMRGGDVRGVRRSAVLHVARVRQGPGRLVIQGRHAAARQRRPSAGSPAARVLVSGFRVLRSGERRGPGGGGEAGVGRQACKCARGLDSGGVCVANAGGAGGGG